MITSSFASCTHFGGSGHVSRQAFTLFEVSISLVLVAFGVVSVLMLFPAGLKAQQMARFQILAAAKAEEMIEQFNGTQQSNPAIDSEGLAMWDVPVAHKAQSWDLESKLSSHRYGIMPMPLDIARRLDSDGDEIQQILGEGGFVYFSQPLASTGTQEQGAAASPPNEAQKMIIGVKGYAQQNALSSFPLKNWPYHTPMPSPPLQMQHIPDKFLPKRVLSDDPTNYKTKYYSYYSWPWMDNEDQIFNGRMNVRNNSENYCVPWETSPGILPLFAGDPDIQKVYDWPDDTDLNMAAANFPTNSAPKPQPLHVGYFPYACGKLWETGQEWYEWDNQSLNQRHQWKLGSVVTRGGNHYTSLVDHLADSNVNRPANAAYWQILPLALPSTHLEQLTRNRSTVGRDFMPPETLRSGDAVYGEYPSRASVKRYVAATLWYANQKGFSWAQIATAGNPYADFTKTGGKTEKDYWMEVQTFRFLAHATTCLTGWYSYDKISPDTEDLKTGITIPQVHLAGTPAYPPMDTKITHDLIVYYHERSQHLINLFASSYPYDWMMPRPLNRVTMMDFPLLQFDMFSDALPKGLPTNPLYDSTSEKPPLADGNPQGMTTSISNSNYVHLFGRNETDNPQQWRVVSPEPIRNIGVSATYPTNVIDSRMNVGTTSHFGDISHYNISAPFSAAERCRELIFWVVDWQSYEDFETAPSAPVDSSKYPLGAPRSEWHECGHIIPTRRTRSFGQRMGDLEFRDEQLFSYRNPEKTLLFFKLLDPDDAYQTAGNTNVDVRTLPTGTPVEQNMVLNRPWNAYPDKGSNQENRMNFMGAWGADRNFNKVLDRGPLPKSVRLRAVQVARFNFYDPRVQAVVR